MSRTAWIAGAACALAGLPAAAQTPPPPADPIGALIQRQEQAIPDEPDEAAEAPSPSAGRATPPVSASTLSDLALDSRIRASMASAQGFQGPLDGGWTLSAEGADLYVLQLADKGRGVVEGAWRDLRRPGALEGSGFIDQIERVGGEMTVRFGGGRSVAVLHGTADGRWTGELTEGGQRRAVRLTKRP